MADNCEDQNLFSTMCRLCLCQNVELINLYPTDETTTNCENKILEIIERFTTVKIHPWDHLPQKICESCIQTIKSMLAFQNKCKRNDEELHKMIENRDESKSEIAIFDDTDTKDILQVNVDGLELESLKSDGEIANNENCVRHNQSHQNVVKDANELLKPMALNSQSNSVPQATNDYPRWRPPPIACHICGKLYDKYHMQFHINKHNGLRPYKCDVDNCASTFAAPYELRNHKRVCHLRKPGWSCDVCGRAFKRSQALKMHRRSHFDPEIPCKICEKLFKTKPALIKHMLVHSQERKFKCDTCRKSFQTRYTLRIHKRVHTQEKPYSCHCGVSFAYNCLLKAHNEKYHKEAKSLPSTT